MSATVKRNPRVREDKKCHVCRKSRTLTVPKKSALSGEARRHLEKLLALDPFCSSFCCRKYFGAELDESPHARAQREYQATLGPMG